MSDPLRAALDLLCDTCHADAVRQGFWAEAEGGTPGDARDLALLAALVAAVGTLCDRQRKEGTISPTLTSAIRSLIATMECDPGLVALSIPSRDKSDGHPAIIVPPLPPDGRSAHWLRQLLHVAAECGEAIRELVAHDYRSTPAFREEVGDIAIVVADLGGPLHISPTMVAKIARNRERPRGYGRTSDE